jgi:hypothetical protein
MGANSTQCSPSTLHSEEDTIFVARKQRIKACKTIQSEYEPDFLAFHPLTRNCYIVEVKDGDHLGVAGARDRGWGKPMVYVPIPTGLGGAALALPQASPLTGAIARAGPASETLTVTGRSSDEENRRGWPIAVISGRSGVVPINNLWWPC